jgi:hypothetical protein
MARLDSDSDIARECGHGFLAISEVYEDMAIAYDSDVVARSIVGLLIRGRHLLRSAYLLADADHHLDSLLLVRTLAEFGLTLEWLGLDPDLHVRIWIADSHRSTFTADEELRRLAAQNPRDSQARRVAELFLPSDARTELEDELDLLRNEIQSLRREPQRRKELRLERLPSLKARAEAIGQPGIYSLWYRTASQSMAHPTASAVQQLFGERDDIGAWVVRAKPAYAPDPYAIGAAFFLGMLDKALEVVPVPADLSRLAELRDRFFGLGISPDDGS